MKTWLMAAAACCTFSLHSFAQMTVTINGQAISNEQKIKYEDLKTMSVSFTNAKKMPNYVDAKAVLYISISIKGKEEGSFIISKEGATSVAQFTSPETPVVYGAFPQNDKYAFGANYAGSWSLPRWFEELSNNISARDLKVQVGLSYSEILRRDYNGNITKRGDAIDLVPTVVFYVDMRPSNNIQSLNVLKIGAKLKILENEGSKFEKVGYRDTRHQAERPFGKANNYLIFENFQADMIYFDRAKFKDVQGSFEKYIRAIANNCHPKIAEKYVIANTEPAYEWGREVMALNNKTFPQFDEKANKQSAATLPVWETSTLGSLSGVKFQTLVHDYECPPTSKGLDGLIAKATKPKANANEMPVSGYRAVYLFPHPTQPDACLLFVIRNVSSDDVKETDLKEKMKSLEKFLSALIFEK